MRVIAIGGSAGALPALEELVSGLPTDLDAAVLVTVHTPPAARSALPRILSRAGALPAAHATDGAPIEAGGILVAPPNRHLLVHAGQVRLGGGPKVNRHRPSVDAMFASAARWAGPDLIAVVLSGVLDDGAVGAALVTRAGGRVLVQSDALFPSMPRAARAAAPAAADLPVTDLAGAVIEAVRAEPAPAPEAGAPREGSTMRMADSGDPQFLSTDESHLTRIVCPDCNGSLAQVDLPTISYYRCHVGHQWSPESLASAQAEMAETRLWSAVAALEEEAALRRHLAGGQLDPEDEGRHLRAADHAADLAQQITDRMHRPARD